MFENYTSKETFVRKCVGSISNSTTKNEENENPFFNATEERKRERERCYVMVLWLKVLKKAIIKWWFEGGDGARVTKFRKKRILQIRNYKCFYFFPLQNS